MVPYARRFPSPSGALRPTLNALISLSALGFATVISLLGLIMSGRVSPLVALIVAPTCAALAGGFGLATGSFILAGLQQTASVAAMFVFAILYFGVMTDAGMLDPIVDRILNAVGMSPVRIVMGSALLALLVHLDGSGAVTFLVTIPAMLPLFDRLRMDRRVLASNTRHRRVRWIVSEGACRSIASVHNGAKTPKKSEAHLADRCFEDHVFVMSGNFTYAVAYPLNSQFIRANH